MGINSSLFFERLKEARKNLGLNQADAADLVGVTREHWGRCERGAAMPGGEVFMALANAGADVRYILTGKRDFEPPPKLTAEEETMLDYFKQATKEARKAALRALLSAAPESNAPVSGQQVGGNNSLFSTGAGAIQIGKMAKSPNKR